MRFEANFSIIQKDRVRFLEIHKSKGVEKDFESLSFYYHHCWLDFYNYFIGTLIILTHWVVLKLYS
jgi:hypothetical protein